MSNRRTVLAAITVATTLTLAACGADTAPSPAPNASATESSPAGNRGAATPAAGQYGDSDVAFARGMIPHHAQAIEMSDLVLDKDGVDERVTRLAREIKAAQGPEIHRMTGWLTGWGAEVPPSDDTAGMDHSGMGHGTEGMMSEQDMAALADADGATASRLFLEQMIDHHRGAVEMARTQVEQGGNAEATALARTIIETQQGEIAEMTTLLSHL